MGGWVGLTLIIRLSLSSNWTELDWTGTELGNRPRKIDRNRPRKLFDMAKKLISNSSNLYPCASAVCLVIFLYKFKATLNWEKSRENFKKLKTDRNQII